MALLTQPQGNYRFFPTTTNSPYSSGGIAVPGYEVVHATLRRPLSWQDGLALVEQHLRSQGRPRQALCGVELRCAKAYAPDQWMGSGTFNQEYLSFLEGWNLFVDGLVPVGRTNVAPGVDPPSEQVLHGFSYTVPATASSDRPTFVVAGAAEPPTVRPGETTVDALREKTAAAMEIMHERLYGLGATWDDVTDVGIYTVHDILPFLVDEILAKVRPAARSGVTWIYSRPPITDREVEIDLRGVRQDLRL
jgi:hypothetical protein